MTSASTGPGFEGLGVQRWVSKQCESLGMTTPTEIQQQCIPAVLAGKHVIGGAVTGSGKTAAFALPILQRLSEEVYGVFAVVMTPSRELAYQVLDQFVALGAPIGVRTAVLIGGVHHGKQLETLQTRPHVAVATPGRLKMLLETFPEVLQCFRNLRFLVLDEADRLTEGDINEATMDVVKLLGTSRVKRQTLLFSATMNNRLTNVKAGLLPELGVTTADSLVVCASSAESAPTNTDGAQGSGEIAEEGDGQKREEFKVAPNLKQEYLFIPDLVKLPYLVALLRSRGPNSSAIVFTNSCFRCELVRLTLQLLGFPVCSLDSLLNQQQRLNSLAMFKSGIAKVLVATDIAARGLDIPNVDIVVQYDFAKLSATYVHRIGRTARAGKEGTSVALVTESDVYLVHKVEKRLKVKLGLHEAKDVNDDVVMQMLDEVSTAKVQAKLNVEERFGDRVQQLKAVGAERRTETNRAIRLDGASAKRTRSAQGGGKRAHASKEEAVSPRAEGVPKKEKRLEKGVKEQHDTPTKRPAKASPRRQKS